MTQDNESLAGMLTPEQVRFFNTFGYLYFPGLFADRIDKIKEAYHQTLEEHESDIIDWRHQAHGFEKRLMMPQFIDRNAYLSSLIDDERISGLFASLLGDDYSYRGSDANVFNCGTCWHSDIYGALFNYLNVKLIFYLEPINQDSGCLRVIPGSQHQGDVFSNTLVKYLRHSNDSFEPDLSLSDEQVPCQLIQTKPGDVIAFDFRLHHATVFKGNTRNMFTVCAAEKIQEADLPDLRKQMMGAKSAGYDRYYGNQMVETATPERMKHLQQCLDNEYCMQEDYPE